MDDCINCDTLDIAKPQSKTVVELARAVEIADTEIILEPDSITDQKGYILFNGCVSETITVNESIPGNCSCRSRTHSSSHTSCHFDNDKFEIVKFCNAEILENGTVRLYNLVRGLAWYGNDSNTSYPDLIKAHDIGDMAKVGSLEVHYYWTDLQKCIAELQAVTHCEDGLSA